MGANPEEPALHTTLSSLKKYLKQQFGPKAELIEVGEMGAQGTQGMKDFGYGKPTRVKLQVNGDTREVVLSTMRRGKFGHQFYWDRAAILMFQYSTGGRMEKHVRPLGLGYIDEQDNMIPVTDPKEFFIVHEMLPGQEYFRDLERIQKHGLENRDLDRAKDFAHWLARVHAAQRDEPDLYLRRIRELIGGSECIFGLVDSYPHPYELFPPEKFQDLEKKLIDWRWKLTRFTHRLTNVHGDFHPWNVLVQPDGDFRVLDRSRGEWGEPADDISTMASNYLLFALHSGSALHGDFERLYRTLWDTYLDLTQDREMLQVVAPFYVFRGLVIASPQWYPGHSSEVRSRLLRFMENVLSDEEFDYTRTNKYLKE